MVTLIELLITFNRARADYQWAAFLIKGLQDSAHLHCPQR
jgi:hypothetical protein